MKQSFNFEDAGRSFSCQTEEARRPRTSEWWWFTVSRDANRYAPFRSDATDTEESVRSRIVAFYDARLARCALPYAPWRRPAKPNPVPTTLPSPDTPAPLAEEPRRPGEGTA